MHRMSNGSSKSENPLINLVVASLDLVVASSDPAIVSLDLLVGLYIKYPLEH